MLFNSIDFVIFFIVVTTLYFLIAHKYRWLLLLVSSCYFYMSFVPIYILILGFTIIIDYFAGIFLEASTGKKRKLFLIASLIANIAVLAVFKYYNFLNDNISMLLHGAGYKNPIPYLSILLPIGLSFHTFQAMSYTIEVYRGNQKAEKHFGIYALYVMFYPQLVAGPIERPQNMIHQFYEKHHFNNNDFFIGFKMILWGMFKKVVIACTPSSSASSILMSNICAPLSTCWRATDRASSYLLSRMRRANFLEPVTLVRSPTFTKFVSGRTTSGSRPDNRRYGLMIVFSIFFLLNHRATAELRNTEFRVLIF